MKQVDTCNKKEDYMPDIAIVGTGVCFPAHLTLETIDILLRCNAIYTMLANPEELESILQMLSADRDLAGTTLKIVSLYRMYQPNRIRKINYELAVETVLNAAASEKPVAYLTRGNPVVYDSVTQGILTKGKDRGFDVQVFSAISSLDTIMVDLQQEVAPGLQIYEASILVAHNIQLRVDIACLLFQVSVFGTKYAPIDREPRKDSLKVLKDYLLRFYPPEHEVALARSAESWNDQSQIYHVKLQKLDDLNKEAKLGTSMFIPRLHEPEINQTFTEQMSNPESLDSAYLPSKNR